MFLSSPKGLAGLFFTNPTNDNRADHSGLHSGLSWDFFSVCGRKMAVQKNVKNS